jgi:DNA mismatch endonuclease Vsr
MLQTFPRDYKFPTNIPRSALALMIGNALPPEFCRQQAHCVREHLDVIYEPAIGTKQIRSQRNDSMKNKGTTPELFLRSLLCKLGFGHYRLSTSHLDSSPSIVYPSMRKAIFLYDCFWHGHDCSTRKEPQRNALYWDKKLTTNRACDEINHQEIKAKGWSFLVIWQCEMVNNKISELAQKIVAFLKT